MTEPLTPVNPPAARVPDLAEVKRQVQLSERVRLLRNVLPGLIILVVLAVEYLIGLLPPSSQTWAHVLFYGLLGPLVTLRSLDWIGEGTRARERAERELLSLYDELSTSNGQLRAVQQLMRDLTEASDMAAVVQVGARGAVRVTGATHATISVPGGLSASARGDTLLSAPSADLHPLGLDLPSGGQLQLHFSAPPSADTVALAQALAAEIANGVEAARQRTLDLMTLLPVDEGIRAERNMRRLLSRVTGNMASRLGVSCRAAYLADQDGVLRLEYLLDGGSEGAAGSPAPPFVWQVAEERGPLVASAEQAAEVFSVAHSALGLPMSDDDGLIGVLVLGDQRPELFREALVPLLALMAGQATLAVRNARAYLYSEELAISDERARIAREIHDGVAQSLAFAALKLDVVTRQIHRDPQRAEAEVRNASQLLREQIREVRRSIFALRPIDLERYGLLETVRRYVADFGEQNNVRTNLTILGEVQLSPSDEAIVFRILQESLNNVAKHAGAREVNVSLSGGEQVTLQVQDDGVGFDPEVNSGKISSAGGLGLVQMRERVHARGGHYELYAAPGQGTTVTARLPQT